MKSFFTPFLVLSLLLATSSIEMRGQVVLTAADMPSIGTSKTVARTDATGLNLGTASATAQTWDFSSLSGGTTEEVSFTDAATEPAVGEFAGATMARTGGIGSLLGVSLEFSGVSLNDIVGTGFYSKDADGTVYNHGVNATLNIMGVDLGNQNLNLSTPDIFLKPLPYGEQVENTAILEELIPVPIVPGLNAALNIEIGKTIEADAFGTLTMPGNRNYEVIRYHEFIGAHVVLSAVIINVDTSVATNTYRFLTAGQGYPVATVTVDADGNPLEVEYTETTVGVEAPIAMSAAVYPNPSSDKLFFEWNNPSSNAQLTIYNTLGQEVYTTIASENRQTIDVSQWAKGLHTYTLQHENGSLLAKGKVLVN